MKYTFIYHQAAHEPNDWDDERPHQDLFGIIETDKYHELEDKIIDVFSKFDWDDCLNCNTCTNLIDKHYYYFIDGERQNIDLFDAPLKERFNNKIKELEEERRKYREARNKIYQENERKQDIKQYEYLKKKLGL